MKIVFVAIGAHQADAIDIDPGLMLMAAHARTAGWETALEVLPDHRDAAGAAQRLGAHDADLLGFGVYSIAWYEVSSLIAGLRERIDVPVICGGYQPTCAPEETLSAPGVDLVCVGEGDVAFPQLLAKLAHGGDPRGVPGIWVKDADGTLHPTGFAPLAPDLDALPAWDRELFPTAYMNAYHIQKFGRCVPIATGRGCPYHCTFCSNPVMRRCWKEAGEQATSFLRKRSVANVVAEACVLVERFDPDSFFMVDEQFVSSRAWLSEFCAAWKQRVGRKFVVLSTASSIGRRALTELADAGLFLVGMGVEVGDDEVRASLLGKPFKSDDIVAGFDRCRELGVRTFASIMIGLPHETAADVHGTCDLIERCAPDLLLPCVYNPLPGTELRARCDREELLERVRWADIQRRYGHQYNNKEAQLLRVDQDAYLRVRRTRISEGEYREVSDRIDGLVHRIERRFFEREEEPTLRRHLAAASRVPPADRSGVVWLRHEPRPTPPRPLHDALRGALRESIVSPLPFLDNPLCHEPALRALAGAPLVAIIEARGEDAVTLARAAAAGGVTALAPLASCPRLVDVVPPPVADVPLIYHGGCLKLLALLRAGYAGELRRVSLRARASAPDSLAAALLLLAKVAGAELELLSAVRERPTGTDEDLLRVELRAPSGLPLRLTIREGPLPGGDWWRLRVEGEAKTCAWSAGAGHETLLATLAGGSGRLRFDTRAAEEQLAEALLAFPVAGRAPYTSAQDGAVAVALADSARAAAGTEASPVPLEPGRLDPLLVLGQLTRGELQDLLAEPIGSVLAVPDPERAGGGLVPTTADASMRHAVDLRTEDAEVFEAMRRWAAGADTVAGCLGSTEASTSLHERMLGWLAAWALALGAMDSSGKPT